MKYIKQLISIIVFLCVALSVSYVKADSTLYLGITELKTLNSPNMGYAIGNPNTTGKKIWNIVKYPNATSTSSTNINAWCVKAGVGFSDVNKRQAYDKSYNMDTQKDLIAKQNSLFNSLVNGGYYNNVLALLDLIYFPGSNTTEQREQLLNNAGIDTSGDYYVYEITDNDIVAVEQAAIWYFTNSDESIYNKYQKEDWLYFTLNGSTYNPLANYKQTALGGEGYQRNEQCQLLYNYLVKTAKANGANYTSSSTDPITVSDSNAKAEESNGNTIVGPFTITKNNTNSYTLKLTVDDNGKSMSYTLLDSNKNKVSNNDLSKVVGSSFYIQVSSSNLTKLNINIDTSYSTTTKTLWASSSNNQAQPIVVLENENKTSNFNYTYTPEKQFDLALRKYITKVNGTNVATSRVPNVDTTPLIDKSSTTANYYGPKNPVEVTIGDVVTYNISIYNEAQKAGRAVTITDQLPAGMEFDSIVSGSYKVKSYDKTTNIVIFERTNTTNLSPFENTATLSSETLTYTAKIVDASNDDVLTNVAWISEEYNAYDNQTIIKQTYPADQNADRDSTPDIHPDVDKDNMSSYKGNSSNKSVTPADSNYFYKGEQDDDDFEKVIVKVEEKITGTYSIILQKLDENFKAALTGATFTINGKSINVDNSGIIDLGNIDISSENDVHTYVIKETIAPDGYNAFDGTITLELHFKVEDGKYVIDTANSKIKVTDSSGNTIDYSDTLKISATDSTLVLKVANTKIPEGSYNFQIIKEDKENAKALEGAEFEVNGKTAKTDENGILQVAKNIEVTNASQIDTYVIKETKAPDGYTGFDGTVTVELHYVNDSGVIVIDTDNTKVTIKDANGKEISSSDLVSYELTKTNFILHIKNEPIPKGKYSFKIIKEDKENAKALEGAEFEVNGKTAKTDENGVLQVADDIEVEDVSQIDTYVIKETKAPEGYTGFEGTVTVELHYLEEDGTIYIDTNKTVVTIKDSDGNEIESSDLVSYELTKTNFILHIKNEPIPKGTYSIKIIKEDKDNAKALEGAEFDINGKTAKTDENGILQVVSDIEITSVDQVDTYIIKETKAPEGYSGFDGTITVELHYKAENSTYVIDTNTTVVTIKDASGNVIESSDLVSYEIEKNDCIIHIKNCPLPFDLALIKNLYAVNGNKVPDRLLGVDVSTLNLNGATEQPANSAVFKQNKNPYTVETGDILTYRIRVYNEGYIDGYASQITEDIPTGLEFLWSEKEGEELDQDITFTDAEKEAIKFNQKMLWVFNATDNTVSTDILSKENETTPGENLIKAFGYNDGTKTEADLDYKEVYIMLRVIATDTSSSIRNEACITKDEDYNGNDVQDRDSSPDKWVKYEDDEDYDNVKLQNFDLALRKWIKGVSSSETFSSSDYLKNSDGTYQREPVVDTSKLNTIGDDGKLITTAIYNGPKTPVSVTINDYVIYCIRVYNEGGIDGYASIITDYLPPYLEFVDNSFNKNYGWTVSSDGRVVTTQYLNNILIPAASYDSKDNITLSYADVEIMCRVKNTTQAGYINTNIAEIMKYEDKTHQEVTDRDSKPGDTVIPSDSDLPTYMDDKTGSYIPGQYDDDDFEKVVCNIFDLALKKWVYQVITTVNGKTTVTNTGFSPYDNPEQIAKVEIYRKSIDTTKVSFVFGIRVINQGNVAGYAKEVTDYIPEGLSFNASSNPQWKQVNSNTVTTDALANTLLQPGSYADVFITLDWINGSNNMGLKTNWAEISKDYNDQNIPDIDSIPGNNVKTEDDIDDAQVLLSVSTGGNKTNQYIILFAVVTITLATGIFAIKKFVLDTM